MTDKNEMVRKENGNIFYAETQHYQNSPQHNSNTHFTRVDMQTRILPIPDHDG